jgi:hypothetical protein
VNDLRHAAGKVQQEVSYRFGTLWPLRGSHTGMKTTRQLSFRAPTVARVATPFPLLWIFLGLTVDRRIFTAWTYYPHSFGSMASSTARSIVDTTIIFTFVYLCLLSITYIFTKRITWPVIVLSSVVALVLGMVFGVTL